MKKFLLALCLVAVCSISLNAQMITQRACAADEIYQAQNKNPKIRDIRKQIEERTRQFVERGAVSSRSGILTIPVYVHVIYNTSQQNISDAQIQSQIDVINEDFRAMNSDIGGVPSEFTASDFEIEFTLTQITRKYSSRTSWGTNDDMKKSSQGGVDPITPDTHLNMWVCNIGGGILGYAQFPGGPASTDGVVMSPQYFGSSDKGTGFYLSAPFDKGRTTTHEIGHYLNLRHIWGDGNCNVDDFVSDTPTAASANYGCPSYPSKSCNNNGGYTSDQFMNYMDYVDDACMFMFTPGQRARVDAIFEPGGARENLGTIGGGCTIGTPANVASSNVQDNSFTVSWNAVSGAASYDVNVSGSVTNTTGTSLNVTGLDAGTTYAVQVRANCTSGSGSYSSPINVTTTGSNCKTGANLTLITDNYASETSWTLTRDGSQVASGSGYSNNTTYNIDLDYGAGSYVFTINDSYGDGICCSYGNGSYTITDNGGSTIASGGAFGSSEQQSWCLEGGAPDTQAPSTPTNVTASNVTQTSADISWNASSDNVGVTGYDVYVDGSLDGSTASTSYSVSGLTASTSYSVSVRAKDAAGNVSGSGSVNFTTQSAGGGGGSETLIASTFETGWEGWSDGGSDCYRYSGSRSYEGSYSIRLRDNSGTASSMTSGSFDVSGYSQIDIEFYFYAYSMENGEDFWVRYYDGSSWNTVAAYARGTNFNNNTFYTATVTINSSQYNFPSNAQFRFQCDASANADHIYIDQVTITASNGARSAGNTLTSLGSPDNMDFALSGTELDGLSVYPSPASSFTNIAFDADEDTEVTLNIFNMEGRVIKTAQFFATEGLYKYELDLNGFERGLYFIDLSTSYGNESAKLIVR